MRRRFNIIILLFLTYSINVFSETKYFDLLKSYDEKVLNNSSLSLFFDYCCDYLTINLSSENVEFNNKTSQMCSQSDIENAQKKIKNGASNGYLLYDAYYDENNLFFKVTLQTDEQVADKTEFIYNITNIDKQAIMLDAWLFFEESINQLKDKLAYVELKPIIKKAKPSVAKKKIEHNFPYFSLSLLTTSLKLYFDQRTSSKIFSFFPVDICASFYPLKYMEVGAFFRLDYDDMIFKYYDVSRGTFSYYTSVFKFAYGLFVGGSFFLDNFHYSLGFKCYNFHLYIADSSWKKTGDYRSEFFPQFAFYQKLDVKIFKFLSYSVEVSIKTTQEFILNNNQFYSEPFKYDFITLEVSLLGFTITF